MSKTERPAARNALIAAAAAAGLIAGAATPAAAAPSFEQRVAALNATLEREAISIDQLNAMWRLERATRTVSDPDDWSNWDNWSNWNNFRNVALGVRG